MSVRGLLEKKQELVNKWEEIFGVKIEEALTDEGLKAFWSAKTSLKGAMAMLDAAAAIEALGDLPEDALDFLLDGFSGVAIVTVGGKADEKLEQKPLNAEKDKRLLEVGDKFYILDDNTMKIHGTYSSYDQAHKEMMDLALNTELKLSDLSILSSLEVWDK